MSRIETPEEGSFYSLIQSMGHFRVGSHSCTGSPQRRMTHGVRLVKRSTQSDQNAARALASSKSRVEAALRNRRTAPTRCGAEFLRQTFAPTTAVQNASRWQRDQLPGAMRSSDANFMVAPLTPSARVPLVWVTESTVPMLLTATGTLLPLASVAANDNV